MMTILLVINLVFFCLIVFSFICGIWKSGFLGKSQMTKYIVFVELVFVMGIIWIATVRKCHFVLVMYFLFA